MSEIMSIEDRRKLLDGVCPNCGEPVAMVAGPKNGAIRRVLCMVCINEFAVSRSMGEIHGACPEERQANVFGVLRRCHVCGCIDTKACVTNGTPCHWVEWDLCSACESWALIETAPRNGSSIEVRMPDGTVYPDAHWAQDLSGEDQPPYIGWFIPDGPGAMRGIPKPAYWRLPTKNLSADHAETRR